MDPIYLKQDELEYELRIRQISPTSADHLDTLRQVLGAEASEVLRIPRDSLRLKKVSVVQEIKECEIKLNEISKESEEALRVADDESIVAVKSRLLHLIGRVSRLKGVALNHSAVDRLLNKINKLEELVQEGRDSLGVEDQASYIQEDDLLGFDEDLTAQGDVFRGAIPKTTVMNTSYKSSNEHFQLNKRTGSSNKKQSSFNNVSVGNSNPAEFQPYKTQPNIVNPSSSQNIRNPFSGKNIQSSSGLAQLKRQYVGLHSAQYNDRNPPINTTMQSRPNTINHDQHIFNQSDPSRLSGGHRIRQWSLRFSGSPSGLDASDFIFRVERQAQLDGVTQAALVIGIGDLLTDRASQWYWMYQRKDEGLNWGELRQAFINRFSPRRETDHAIRSKIENRKQRPGESFGDFCLDIEGLAVKLSGRMSEDDIIEVLRRNMTLYLRKALWRHEVNTVDELICLCDELESMCEEEAVQNKLIQRRLMRVNELEVSNIGFENNQFNKESLIPEVTSNIQSQIEALHVVDTQNKESTPTCWNCKQVGHTFLHCPVDRQGVFCYSCGRSGILRPQCTNPRCMGNLARDGPSAEGVHPKKNGPQSTTQCQQPPKSNPFRRVQ